MARSHPWVVVMLLWFLPAAAAQAGSRTKAPVPPSAAAPAPTAASPAAGPAASPAAGPTAGPAASPATPAVPAPANGPPLEPPPAGAKADQIADYATALFKQQRYSEAG